MVSMTNRDGISSRLLAEAPIPMPPASRPRSLKPTLTIDPPTDNLLHIAVRRSLFPAGALLCSSEES
jgi:hypothetical protein